MIFRETGSDIEVVREAYDVNGRNVRSVGVGNGDLND